VNTNAQNAVLHSCRKHARGIFREDKGDRLAEAFFKIQLERTIGMAKENIQLFAGRIFSHRIPHPIAQVRNFFFVLYFGDEFYYTFLSGAIYN
jgi:hypothetical protein